MILSYKVFVNTMGIVVFAYLVQSIYNIHINKKTLLHFIIATSAGVNVILLLDRFYWMGFRTLMILVFMTVMSFCILKLSLIQSIISNIVSIIVLAVGDMSVLLVMVKAYGFSIETVKGDIFLSIGSDLIIYGTYILIAYFIRQVSKSREMTDAYKRAASVRTSVYMLVTFSIIAVNYSINIKYIGIIDEKLLLINIGLIWIFLILSLYMNYMNSALTLKEQQCDQQQDYIRTIDSLLNDFRKLKHNHANTIYSIYGYIQENDIEGLKSYYSEIMEETGRMDNNVLLVIQKIKIYAIFGLIWSKVREAEAAGIKIAMQVPNEVASVGMKLKDLCDVLGNYLDNAIEAAAKSEDKSIDIFLGDDEDYLTVRIKNTFAIMVDTEKIYEKGFSTKGKGRGHGLPITEQILSQYHNLLHNTIIGNKMFIQELIIKK